MRKKRITILAACTLAGICTLQAQEFSLLPAELLQAEHGRLLPTVGTANYSIPWLRDRTDPILRQRRAISASRMQQAQRSILLRNGNALPAPDPNPEIARWRAAIGNTAVNNWSPYPDRALDARTLRFPQPRNMQPDKRPAHLRALDRMKH